jgi:hypothetical protein
MTGRPGISFNTTLFGTHALAARVGQIEEVTRPEQPSISERYEYVHITLFSYLLYCIVPS